MNRTTSENKTKRLVIVGLPNTGKSSAYNNLTGDYTLVSNLPLTTIEEKRGACDIGDETWEVFDTPGLHCLYIHSEEELQIRDLLYRAPPDVILQCIDADRIKQSLTLTADLLDLAIPLVISLNSIDETARNGVLIDSASLALCLGTQVVESSDENGRRDVTALKTAIVRARRGGSAIVFPKGIEEAIGQIASSIQGRTPYPRKTALLALLDDPFIGEAVRRQSGREVSDEIAEKTRLLKQRFNGNPTQAFFNTRTRWVEGIISDAMSSRKATRGNFGETFGHLSRHPIYGLPILAFFILVTFYLVVFVSGFLADGMDGIFVQPMVHWIEGWIAPGWWRDFLVGEYGLLTLGLFNALCTILPILSVFFLMLAFVEDIGYLPCLTVLTERLFKKIGLSGKAIMPLILGFSCKTMATLTTKSLRSRKERLIAIYLIAFAIPCGAQLGVEMAILGTKGLWAFLIAFGALFVFELAAGFALNKIIRDDGRRSDFIQELPSIHMPNAKAIFIKTYYRLKWFLKEAIPIFLIAAVGVFFLDKAHILGAAKGFVEPLTVGWLGLPTDIVDVLILSMVRQEIAAGTLMQMSTAGVLNVEQCIVAVVLLTCFIPCLTNIVAMCKEIGMKTGLLMVLAINVSAFILAGILHWILVLTIF